MATKPRRPLVHSSSSPSVPVRSSFKEAPALGSPSQSVDELRRLRSPQRDVFKTPERSRRDKRLENLSSSSFRKLDEIINRNQQSESKKSHRRSDSRLAFSDEASSKFDKKRLVDQFYDDNNLYSSPESTHTDPYTTCEVFCESHDSQDILLSALKMDSDFVDFENQGQYSIESNILSLKMEVVKAIKSKIGKAETENQVLNEKMESKYQELEQLNSAVLQATENLSGNLSELTSRDFSSYELPFCDGEAPFSELNSLEERLLRCRHKLEEEKALIVKLEGDVGVLEEMKKADMASRAQRNHYIFMCILGLLSLGILYEAYGLFKLVLR